MPMENPSVCEAKDCTGEAKTGFQDLGGRMRLVCKQHADLLAAQRPVEFPSPR